MDTLLQKSYNIHLIGDSCDDVYHYGTCERLSPEAPVPVLKEIRRETLKGMSWNVRLNVEAFGSFVTHFTNDEKMRKHRFIDSKYNQHLLRWDEGEENPLSEFNTALLRTERPPDAVVISDYNKGFLTPDICCEIIEYYKNFHKSIPIFVDSKKKDLSCFEDVFIKINEKEFNSLEIKPANSKFIVTLGERGAMYGDELYETEPVEVFDVCGAGDVFLATLSNVFLFTGSIPKAIRAANRMASLSVTHMGTYVITRENIGELNDLRV